MSIAKDPHRHGIDRYHELDLDTDPAEQLNSIYSDWASTYDQDNDNKLKTVSQPNTVAMFKRHCANMNVEILDVGCGTGLVGHNLAKAGFTTFDGTDPTLAMLTYAEQRGYRKLFILEPGLPLPVSNHAYDATLCVGVFTHGHLGVEGFEELLRITKPGGLIAFTVNEGVWETGQFASAIDQLERTNQWKILEKEKRDYMINVGVQAWYITARKI